MGSRREGGSLNTLVRGTAVLSIAAVITKIIGLIYKIPLIGYVGIEGMAYFLAANHVYVFLFVISTSGLPVAVSILVSQSAESVGGESRGGAAAVFRAALFIFLVIGAAGTLIMLLAAGPISVLINIKGAALSIAAISPAILMACVSGAYRGYFQGFRQMKYTAISQIIESAGKLVLGLAGAVAALRLGYEPPAVAAFAIFGITLGVAFSTMYLILSKRFFDIKSGICRKADKTKPRRSIALELIKIALPITLSSAVLSLTGLIDTALIANCLGTAGFSVSMINRLYSCYGNISVPLFSLTPALIAPVSMAAVPLISAAAKNGDYNEIRKVAGSAIRITLLAALPASAGLSVFSSQIITLIFPSQTEAAQIAAPLLSVLALSIVPVCMTAVTNAILQARGRAGMTIISMLAGAAVKIIFEFLLVRMPSVNISGAPVSTFICSLCVAGMNIYFMLRYVPGLRVAGRKLFSAAASAVAAVGGAMLVWRFSSGINSHPLRVLLLLAAAALLYIAFILITGALDRELIGMLPGGGKNSKMLGKNSGGRLREAGERT